MSKLIKSTNSLLSALISQLNLGSLCRLRYITINNSNISFDIIHLLYKEGVIRLYILQGTKILVFFKYFKGCHLFKFKIISKPSNRYYYSLNKLSLTFSKNNFSGFFVISTPNGLMTSILVYYIIIYQVKYYLKFLFSMNLKIYKFYNNLDLYFLKKYNIFFLKTFLGIFYYYLPSYYFYKISNEKFSFIFLKNFFFRSFISHFFFFYNNLNNIYIIRLKIKGLGYQIYKLTNNLYSFHFHFINFFYLFLPLNIITCWYKKRILLISNNFFILK